jgi:hypothetical protein
MALRDRKQKPPSTGEFLVWLRILAYSTNASPKALEKYTTQLSDLGAAPPFVGALLKNKQDLEDFSAKAN